MGPSPEDFTAAFFHLSRVHDRWMKDLLTARWRAIAGGVIGEPHGIGIRLRACRKAKGLKQIDVANACGVKQQAVSEWERAEVRPSYVHCQRLARLFKLRPADFWEDL
jgi:DNA-binding XRE family transcriptional regulator